MRSKVVVEHHVLGQWVIEVSRKSGGSAVRWPWCISSFVGRGVSRFVGRGVSRFVGRGVSIFNVGSLAVGSALQDVLWIFLSTGVISFLGRGDSSYDFLVFAVVVVYAVGKAVVIRADVAVDV